MSSDRAQEAYPLMGKPRPTAPADPGSLPPPYSSLFGEHSQAYTPVRPPPIRPPYPTEMTSAQAQIPMPMPMPIPHQATAPYPTADEETMPLPVYAPTTYDPTSSDQPVSPVQTVNVSTSSDNRKSDKASCLPLKIIAVILIILISGFGLAMSRRARQRQREIAETRRFDSEIHTDYSRWPRQRYNDRYRWIVHDEQPHSKDHGFLVLNDRRRIAKSIKSEILQRKQSIFKTIDSFRKNNNGRSYKKKGKCCHR